MDYWNCNPFFKLNGENNCEVDTTNPKKVLSVTSENSNEGDVIKTVDKACYMRNAYRKPVLYELK